MRRRMCLCFVCLSLLFPAWCAWGEMVIDDRDWRAAGQVTQAEGVEYQMTPALLLQTEFKPPVLLFDPTDDETITDIVDFQGKLYLSSCTKPASTATGSVFVYDAETNQWQKSYQVNDEGLVRLEVWGDRLYIAGYDANDGGWDLGNIYVFDGKEWVEHRTVPRAIHEYGLAVYRGRIYVSGDLLDPAPEGMTVDEAAQKELIAVYGRVVSSGDGGKTWREEYRGAKPGQDVGAMTVFQDRLILNAHGDLVIFNGKRWKRLGLNPNSLFVYTYQLAGDLLLLGTSEGLCFFQGNRFWRAEFMMFWGLIYDITRFGSKWVLVDNVVNGGIVLHGPGGINYPELEPDAPRFVSRLWLVSDEGLHNTAAGKMDDHLFFQQVAGLGNEDFMIVSAHAFAGRLFLGTHPEGKVMVLPVVKEGVLESKVYPIQEAGTYRISWKAAAPEGTSCQMQVRMATTSEALQQAPFTPYEKVIHVDPGFLQYRVVLKTENPALSPYVQRVVLERE